MASRKPPPEAQAGPHADDIVRSAVGRGLGSRHRWRLFAIAAWTSFLGTALVFGALLLVLPSEVTHALHLGELSAVFLSCWPMVMVAVVLGMMLNGPSATAVHRAHAQKLPHPDEHARGR